MPTFRFCEFCKQYFEEELETHEMNCTSKNDDSNQCTKTEHSLNSELAQCSNQELLEKERVCEFCSDLFPTQQEVTIHREVCKHEKVKCEECSVRLKRRNMAKHMKKHFVKAYVTKCYYCDKEMQEEALKSHTLICDLSLVRCEKCQVRIQRFFMTQHLTMNCIKRMIQCEYCNCQLVADSFQHFEVCTLIPVYCENKCGQKIKRKELQHHMDEECPKRVIECEYCAKHLEFELLETHYSECERYEVSCPKLCGQSVPREEVEKHLDEACDKLYAKCMYQAVSCTFEGFPVDIRKHMEDKNVFHAEITNIKIGNLSIVVENQDDIISTLEGKLKKTEEKVSELEENLKMKEKTTPQFLTSGRFLWRIEDIPENLKLFTFNKVLCSNTFYDSEYGYNLQVRLYPNGIDYYKVRDCLGIFVSIYPGAYDSLLEWPFQKRVTFTLIDQKDRANDVVNYVDGYEGKCFQKPVNEGRNTGKGIPNFVTHEKVASGHYICNNVMFVEVKIE